MKKVLVVRSLLLLFLVVGGLSPAPAQRRAPRAVADYGLSLTYAIYGYDEEKSQTFNDLIRLSATFSTAQEEISFIRDRYGAEEMVLRHVRNVGLTDDESFIDVQRIGPDFMTITVAAQSVTRRRAHFSLQVKYGTEMLLEQPSIPLDNFETILLKGKPGMFGLRTFVGLGGVQESAPAQQTLLVTVTAELAPVERLRNRPRELTYPTDENGAPLKWEAGDEYIAPYVVSKVEPTLPLRRPLGRPVILQGIITPEGKVTNVRVISSIDPDIDKLAIDAFRRYQFQGAKLNGKPVAAAWREEIHFRVPGQ